MNSSIDPSEIQHFACLAQDWWDEKGPFKALHDTNLARLSFLKEHICKHFSKDMDAFNSFNGLSFLDVGCGGGLMSEPLARLNGQVTGIDATAQNIEVASQHAQEAGLAISYAHQTVEEHAHAYDVVIALEILEHVANPCEFIANCIARVKPGGLIFLSTLNRTSASYLLGIVAAENILKMVPKGTHQWEKFMTPGELKEIIEANNAMVSDIKGIGYSIFEKCWQITQNKMINYIVCAVKN